MFFLTERQKMPQRLQQLCQILQHASQLLEQQYQQYLHGQQFEILTKDDQSPVTQADLCVHQYLSEQLQQYFPHITIISEEQQNANQPSADIYWLIDPLDGTKEFIRKTGEFTINLSLIQNGVSIISALAVPLQHCIYINQQYQLPFKWIFHTAEIEVYQYQHQERKENRPLVLAFSRNYKKYDEKNQYQAILDELEKKNIQYELFFAGSAYKFCLMLEGKIDIYPRMHPTQEWDTAAGQGLLQSIGGEVFDLKHRPFLYNQRNTLKNGAFIAVKNQQDWYILSSIF